MFFCPLLWYQQTGTCILQACAQPFELHVQWNGDVSCDRGLVATQQYLWATWQKTRKWSRVPHEGAVKHKQTHSLAVKLMSSLIPFMYNMFYVRVFWFMVINKTLNLSKWAFSTTQSVKAKQKISPVWVNGSHCFLYPATTHKLPSGATTKP